MGVKYIFVTGGVVSGIGKGITAASLGRLLKSRGLRVTMQKFDPYINIDPGTMSPYQHGEVFVTEDGAETDLDLGHYERFIDENLTKNSNVTAGKVYWSVITKERRGAYLGGTVQVIPHITNEIKEKIFQVGHEDTTDVVITEIGGTVGDIESQPFLEAIRQVAGDVGKDNSMYIHVTLVPYLSTSGEQKSKPTQHSVKELLGIGIQPDIIVCRSEVPLDTDLKAKIGLFCNIPSDCVIENLDAESLYDVPLMLEERNLSQKVCERLKLDCREPELTEWVEMAKRAKNLDGKVKIALVGKYVALRDAYLSVAEALRHGGFANDTEVQIEWIDAECVTDENVEEFLSDVDGVLVPGGFGDRGIDGKISAIKYARENNIPFLGICLGMQLAVVEYARNVAGLSGAHSFELNPNTPYPVIDLMPEQKEVDDVGGTMRLGKFPCVLEKDTNSYKAYNKGSEDGYVKQAPGLFEINERHRHRYELNNAYRDKLSVAGLKIAGTSPSGKLVEIVEIEEHPWFVGVQFHPEFKSRPNKPHPIFEQFIYNALLKNRI